VTTKADRLEMRLTPELKKLLERAAAISGQSVAAFVRTAVEVRAAEVVREQLTTQLSPRDMRRFVRILEEDEEPSPALKAAVRWFTSTRKKT